jgi:hypothetical protein
VRAWDPVTTRTRLITAQRVEVAPPASMAALEEEVEAAQASAEAEMKSLRTPLSASSAGGEVSATSVLRELQDVQILVTRDRITPEALSEWLTEAAYEATKIPD